MFVPDVFKNMQEEEVMRLELPKLVPLMSSYLEGTAEELLREFGADQLQLLKLSRALILRFFNAYMKLAEQSSRTGCDSQAVRHSSDDDLSVAKRLNMAALRIQAVWRKFQACRRLQRNLLGIVFEEFPTPRCSLHLSGAPAVSLRQQRSHILNWASSDKISEVVRSVRVVRRTVGKVMVRLRQHGLDLAAAFRSADKSYPEVKAAMPVGQYMVFLVRDQKVSLLPAERTVLLRLFQAPGSRSDRLLSLHSKESAPRDRPHHSSSEVGSAGSDCGILQEAMHSEMKYTHVLELAHVFRVSSEVVEKEEPWKVPLEAVRKALVEAGKMDGRSTPSWRGLLLDAHVSHLLEERARLKATLDDEARCEDSKVLEVEHQLAVCAAQLSAAGKPGASPRVAVPVVIARLLQERLKGIAPVTIHAAVHVASETRCERRSGQSWLRLASTESRCGPSDFVEFDAPLPAPPSLLHLALPSEDQFEVDLESLSACGMCLRMKPRPPRNGQHYPRGPSSKLRALGVRFQAGAARGTARVRLMAGGSAGRVEVTFLPHLGRVPSYVVVETFQASGQTAPPEAGLSCGILGMGLLVKRLAARGFTFRLPPMSDRKESSKSNLAIWYEAVSMEPAVTAERLQELAELPGDAADADSEVAKRLPEEVLLEASGVLDAQDALCDLEGDAEVGDASYELEDDSEVGGEEEEDQFEALMNRRALHRLAMRHPAAQPAAEEGLNHGVSSARPSLVVHQPELAVAARRPSKP